MLGEPLLQSMVGERIWQLYRSDTRAFKREVVAYFARGYPGYRVVRADPRTKLIYLRDERVK